MLGGSCYCLWRIGYAENSKCDIDDGSFADGMWGFLSGWKSGGG